MNRYLIKRLYFKYNASTIPPSIFYKKLITDAEFNQLNGIFKTRCDCAHPTDRKIKPNEAIGIFENLFEIIFTKKGLS